MSFSRHACFSIASVILVCCIDNAQSALNLSPARRQGQPCLSPRPQERSTWGLAEAVDWPLILGDD